MGDDRRAVRRADARSSASVVLPYLLIQAVLGFSLLEVVNYLEHYGLLREQARGRPLRAHRAGAQLEHQQRRLERAALPPAAPLRPPRQPDPPLPGAAPLRGGAAAADGLRGDDRARRLPPAVAARDGPAACSRTTGATWQRANIHPRTRRRVLARYGSPAAPTAAAAGGHAMSAWRCPSCGYAYDERPATRARASRPARRGARCPTTGPARTAACATRSTSSEETEGVGERSRARARPTRRPPASCCATRCLTPPATSWSGAAGRDHDGRLAAAAGVSRQTLYKEFGSRDEFAQAFVMREADRFLAAVEVACTRTSRRSGAALSAAFECSSRPPPRTRCRALLIRRGGETAAARDDAGRARRGGRDRASGWAIILAAGRRPAGTTRGCWPSAGAPGDQLRRAPVAGPAGMTAASVGELLGPYIDHALADAMDVSPAAALA